MCFNIVIILLNQHMCWLKYFRKFSYHTLHVSTNWNLFIREHEIWAGFGSFGNTGGWLCFFHVFNLYWFAELNLNFSRKWTSIIFWKTIINESWIVNYLKRNHFTWIPVMLTNFRGSRLAVLFPITSALSSVSSVLLEISSALLEISWALMIASAMSVAMLPALSDILSLLVEISSALPVTKPTLLVHD